MFVFVGEFTRRLPADLQPYLDNSAEAARLAGAQVFSISLEDWRDGGAERVLHQIPHQEHPTPAVRFGCFPSSESYRDFYEAAAQKNIFLLNTPGQQKTLLEFELVYPFLEGLTPRVLISHSLEAAIEGAQQLDFPIFVKDARKKNRHPGQKEPPIAENLEELEFLCAQLFTPGHRAPSRVVLREEPSLRRIPTLFNFHVDRDFVLFLYRGEVLGFGSQWEDEDPVAKLTPQERQDIEELARTAAQRLPAPYVAISLCQRENGEWLVTETGDPQFTGFRQIVPLTYWRPLVLAQSSTQP